MEYNIIICLKNNSKHIKGLLIITKSIYNFKYQISWKEISNLSSIYFIYINVHKIK